MDSRIEITRTSSSWPRMKIVVKYFLLLFILSPLNSFAQSTSDTLRTGNNNEKNVEEIIDSIQSTKLARIDSIKNRNYTKVDSISRALNDKLDVATNNFNSKIDSLNRLNLSTESYSQKLDSLYKSFQSGTINNLKSEYDSLGIRVDQKLSRIESFIEEKSKALDSLITSRKGKPLSLSDKVSLERINTKLPLIPSSPQVDIPTTRVNTNFENVNNPTGIEKLPNNNLSFDNLDMPNVAGLNKLNQVTGIVEKGRQIPTETKEIKEEVKEEVKKAKDGEYNDELQKKMEEKAQNIDEVKEFTKESKSVEALKKKAESIGNERGMKDAVQAKGKKELKDHFAGKDETIKKDLDEIGKTQLKYRNVADSRNLPKRPPNEMKDKSFAERLIPAISFQVFPSENISVDFVPTIGYRFTGRIRAGFGGYRRATYLQKEREIKIEDLFGFRIYNNIRLVKDFYSHLELEAYKNKLVFVNHAAIIESWDYKLNLGIYQTHKLSKRINGHIIVMYDVLKIKEFPSSSNSGLRFGFDYQISKKKSAGNKAG